MGYINIVFAQGDDADEPLKILNEDGIPKAVEYLAQWDNGNDSDVRDELGAGTTDHVQRYKGYILTWNNQYGYIGLSRRI